MAPQERTTCCEDSRQEDNLANIDLNNGFINKAFTNDVSDNVNTKNHTEEPKQTKKVKDFDDLLPYIGEFGWYQKILFLLMIPFAFFVSIVYFSQIFMTIVPEQHWCWIPELANLTAEERRALAIPAKSDGPFTHDRCNMYSADFSLALEQGRTTPDDEWKIIPCSHGWEYNRSDVPYETIASQLDWVCDKDNYAATAQAIFFCGAIVGGLVFGWIADKYGRIPALVGTNLVGFAAGVATAFCNTFWTFTLCRFLVGLAFDNCFTMMYILVLEYVGPKWRTFVANMSIAIFFTLGASLLPWVALWAGDWRRYALFISAPFIIAAATPWVVPESARWLLSQGKIDKALVIMKKFERVNKTKIPDKVLNEFTEATQQAIKDSEAHKSYSVLDIFKTPRLRKNALLLIVIWMAISLVFDGHVRNVGSLGLDIFLTFTIATATEFPADTFLTVVLDRWSVSIPGDPGTVRGQHLLQHRAAANISPDLPLLILGVLGIVGGGLCLLLPETMDTEMPQTLEDGENFGIDQKFWDNPCFPRKTKEFPEKYMPSPVREDNFIRSLPASGSRASVRASIRLSSRSRRHQDNGAVQTDDLRRKSLEILGLSDPGGQDLEVTFERNLDLSESDSFQTPTDLLDVNEANQIEIMISDMNADT
ncbi:Ectonucleotide pyrophosphatase/phosphodiesterase family member 4 [Danaus plexippus plexippus]|uniref:Ectonucleotide pyrophosphatase/phosphodiesterase family member 4 n=1 Tax=Danaus plexippus plexippus TaxID=278856 RepID=A0A212FD00_DANPL|nr:Ectonucleotide pyrophosphatase/phosphodiesterase family member 4 [Danaus plexippus plexippus]